MADTLNAIHFLGRSQMFASSSQHLKEFPELIYLYFSPSFQQTGHKQQLFDGRTMENKGKLIRTEIFPSVQKHDILKNFSSL